MRLGRAHRHSYTRAYVHGDAQAHAHSDSNPYAHAYAYGNTSSDDHADAVTADSLGNSPELGRGHGGSE